MSGFDQILDELVERHGGDAALGASGLAVVRQVAALIASDTPLDAAGAKAVESLMRPAAPAKTEGSSEWNLELLDDLEFDDLLRLAAKATSTPVMGEDGKLSIVPPPDEVAKRIRAEDLMHAATSRAARAEEELAHTRAALKRVAALLVEAEAKASGAPGAGAGASDRGEAVGVA
jgi:hypothetical protein